LKLLLFLNYIFIFNYFIQLGKFKDGAELLSITEEFKIYCIAEISQYLI